MSQIEEQLAAMGLKLPPPFETPPDVRRNIKPVQSSNNQLHLSSQGPQWGRGIRFYGKVGKDLTPEQGYEAARVAALNLLRLLKDELGDLDRVTRWVKVRGFINCVPEFTRHSNVMNGFSDLIVALYGEERGMHARTVVGVCALPFNYAIDVEAVVEFE
ncbi:MAG: RidA family protein [Anaerolineae bacterium]